MESTPTGQQSIPRGVAIGAILPTVYDDQRCNGCEEPIHWVPATHNDDGSTYDSAAWVHDDPAQWRECPDVVTVVNLTPHVLTVEAFEVAASGQVARIAETTTRSKLDVIRLARAGSWWHYRTSYGGAEGIPEPRDRTIYVVSLLTLLMGPPSLRQRDDVFAPGPEIRDRDGRITGCRGLRSVS
jgi:hypothetical protein